jgi:hypothetical protein
MTCVPWYSYPLLLAPRAIARNLDRVRDAGLVDEVPNLWQLSLGVLRMWHRIAFRPETIGTCAGHDVRPTLRARLLQYRPLRFPFLLRERAVAPWDLTGLASSPDRLLRHMLGAHHDGVQFVYDMQILQCYPGKLADLQRAAREVAAEDTPRARWLRDLAVYESYHDNLREFVDRAVERGIELSDEDARDPDISFFAYLDWCARQPATPAQTWRALRAGRYDFGEGLC